MTDYARRTATAARITRARQEEARRRRAENRRLYGPSTGGPALTRERQAAAFPGFPPLTPAYEDRARGSVRDLGPQGFALSRAQLSLARTRDLAARAGRWAA